LSTVGGTQNDVMMSMCYIQNWTDGVWQGDLPQSWKGSENREHFVKEIAMVQRPIKRVVTN